MSFQTALTGLNAASAGLENISNNIANVATIGFKRSSINFGDIFNSSNVGSNQGAIGKGVRSTEISQSFSQGEITYTDRQLDMSISGSGFFRLNDNGNVAFTRAGNFSVNRNGYLVNSLGHRLTGYPADDDGKIISVLGDLHLNGVGSAPKQTSRIELDVNLGSEVLAPEPFDIDNSETYNASTSAIVYDALGTSYLTTMYFRKADQNQWQVHTYMAGEKIGNPNGDLLKFDSNGRLASINGGSVDEGLNISFNRIGKQPDQPIEINIQMKNSTQYDNPSFSVSSIAQNGYQAGHLTDFEVRSNGIINGQYSNGQSRELGQLALSSFNNPRGLEQVHNTSWIETFDSGDAISGVPGTGPRGMVQSGSLEESNIDLTQGLLQIIGTQRNFQANAQVITANDKIVQTVINIRR